MLTGNREQATLINWLVIVVKRIDLMTPALAASEMFMLHYVPVLGAELDREGDQLDDPGL